MKRKRQNNAQAAGSVAAKQRNAGAAGNAAAAREPKKRRKLPVKWIIVALVFLMLATVFGPLLYCNRRYLSIPPVTKEQLDELHLDRYNKLMIVAHPDDEYIWGGAHLLEDDWFVVVLTNAGNATRKPEFEAMMNETGDVGLILGYPDKVGGKRSNWGFWWDSIRTDIETIVSYKNWDQIVTHNIDGEYGHQHHKYTHSIVVEAYENLDSSVPLWFFGTYYRNVDLPDDLPRVSDETFTRKAELAPIYESQISTVNKFRHMLPHEDWIAYNGSN